MVMNRSLIPVLFAYRPGFEAFVQPKVLCRLFAHPSFDEIIHALSVYNGVSAWEIFPLRVKTQLKHAIVQAGRNGGDDFGIRHLGNA